MMAYCIALGTFWTNHHFFEDIFGSGVWAMESGFGKIQNRRKMGGRFAVGSTPAY